MGNKFKAGFLALFVVLSLNALANGAASFSDMLAAQSETHGLRSKQSYVTGDWSIVRCEGKRVNNDNWFNLFGEDCREF